MAEFLEIIKGYIYPELLVMVPVLYFIGWCVHESEKIDNKFIPIILGIAGIVLATVYMLGVTTTVTFNSIFSTIFAAIIQGMLCAAAAVFVNQLKKQPGKGKNVL